MGYRSDFDLTIEKSILPVDEDAFLKFLQEVTEYKWEHWGNQSFCLSDAKWYEHEEHLKKISESFPDYHICLFITGEEDDDRHKIDALGGQIHLRSGEMVYPERTLW